MTDTNLVDQSPIPFDPQDDEHRVALARTGRFGAQAAGGIVLAARTGRFLLMLRSEGVLESGTYGNCGGAHKKDERPEDATRREVREETGWAGPEEDMTVIPALVYREPEFTYSNFVVVVPDEFEPIYGWEAVGHVWCTISDLPSPLHFGIEAFLNDAASRAILDGGWRDHAERLDPDEAHAMFPEGEVSISFKGGSLPRPLSESTVDRIAKGIAIHIAEQDRRSRIVMEALGIGGGATANMTVEPPFGPSSRTQGSGGTMLVPPAFDPEEGFVVMFSDTDPNGRIIEAGGLPVAPPREYEFTVVLEGDDAPDDKTLDAIYEAGGDDALVAFQNVELIAHFVREAHSIRQAASEALRQLRSVGMIPIAVRPEEPEHAAELEGVLED